MSAPLTDAPPLTDFLPRPDHARQTNKQTPIAAARVLHLVNGQHYAGAARVQDLLAQRLPEHGYEVAFATLLPGRFAAQRKAITAPVYEVPMQGRLDVRPVRALVRLIHEERFDIVHSHTTRSALIGTLAAQQAGVPHVHHVHCQMDTEVGHRLRCLVNRTIEKRACRRADAVIAVSDSIARFLQQHRFTRRAVDVVPNGVPSVAARPARCPQDPWVIGLVALLRARKGLETLLMALPQMAASHPVRLRVVGPFESDGYRNRMYDLSDSLGVSHLIDWTGYTDDVAAELRRMDALVLPSVLPEGMPMVLLEAMAAGVPVLGSRVDGITDVIDHQRNGLLFTAGDHAALAGQVQRLMNADSLWRQLQAQGRTDYQQRYSDTVMAGRVADVYGRLLRSRREGHAHD